MARLNQPRVASAAPAPTTTTHEGAPAYKLGPALDLISLMATTTISPKFYERNPEALLERIRALLPQVPNEVAWPLVAYVRHEMYLRTSATVLAAELCLAGRYDGCEPHLADALVRPDDVTEFLAYWKTHEGHIRVPGPEGLGMDKTKAAGSLDPIPRAVRRAINEAFGRWDPYQLSKWRMEDKDITLRDAMFLCRPKPRPEQVAAFQALAAQTLVAPATWENLRSNAPDEAARRGIWRTLIEADRLPYTAALRNLRLMLEDGVHDEHLVKVLAMLKDPERVRRSKVFPFQYLLAYEAVQAVPDARVGSVLTALEQAALASAANVRGFEDGDRVLVAMDTSGSMKDYRLSEKTQVRADQAGLMLGMMLAARLPGAVTGTFATDWNLQQFPKDRPIGNAMSFTATGGGTNGYKVLQWALEAKQDFDRVVFITDSQFWPHVAPEFLNREEPSGTFANLWTQYRRRVPHARLVFLDIGGYGNVQVHLDGRRGAYFVAGWSDRVFEAINWVDQGKSLVDLVRAYKAPAPRARAGGAAEGEGVEG